MALSYWNIRLMAHLLCQIGLIISTVYWRLTDEEVHRVLSQPNAALQRCAVLLVCCCMLTRATVNIHSSGMCSPPWKGAQLEAFSLLQLWCSHDPLFWRSHRLGMCMDTKDYFIDSFINLLQKLNSAQKNVGLVSAEVSREWNETGPCFMKLQTDQVTNQQCTFYCKVP